MRNLRTNCHTSRERNYAVSSSLTGKSQLVRGEKVQHRRELLAAVLRYATLGTLGAIGGFVFAKRHRLVEDGICINNGICRGCGIFEQCGLPLALTEKQLLTRMDDEQK